MPLLMPKRARRRKVHRGRRKGLALRGGTVAFGEYGIQATRPEWITAQQIEACRTTIVRKLERGGRVWIRIFPDKPVSKKPAEVRMGKGKGDPEFWVAVVKPGRILFEFDGVSLEKAKDIHRLVSYKLPIPSRLRVRRRLGGEK
jgi:large subunit ribosomal protein L16